MEGVKQRTKSKGLFIGLSCLSIGCLVGSFAYPLSKLEVWHQTEINQFKQLYTKVFIITENERNIPYSFNKKKAEKVANIYQDYKFQKLMLLAASIISASIALAIGDKTVQSASIDDEVRHIDGQAQREFLVSQIKHKWAMATQSQKLQFREELKELAALFDDETMEATEINETDKFTNANYMLMEEHFLKKVKHNFQLITPIVLHPVRLGYNLPY